MKVKKNIAISDSGFVFNPSTGDSYSVNPIGLEILELLKDGKDDEFIISYVTQNYMVDRSGIEKDIYDFKNMLDIYKIAQ